MTRTKRRTSRSMVSGLTNSSRGRSARSRSRRSRSLSGRSRRSRSSTSQFLGMPSWLVISLGCVGAVSLIYGLMQLDIVSDFMDPVIQDVGEFFGLSEDEGIDTANITHDRTYSRSVI